MAPRGWRCLLAVTLVACGSTPSPSPPATTASERAPVARLAAPPAAGAEAIPEPPEPVAPSTASYEEAMAGPESLDSRDGRPELTDRELSEPMKGVLGRCRVPSSVRVTIQTAVRNGHAIGVTIRVELPKPKPTKKPPRRISPKAAKAQAALVERITQCADQNVRALTWPTSNRRDSFTTTF